VDIVSFSEIIIAELIVVCGAIVQAATGLGAGILVVPLLILVNPVFVPGPVIFSSLVLTSIMAYKGRNEFVFKELQPTLWGIFIGAVVGVALVSMIDKNALGLFFGVFILGAIFISTKGIYIPMTCLNQAIGGALSGFMGSTVGIGAPILALLYQREPGKRLRPILASLFFVAAIMILSVMAIAGQFSGPKALIGLILSPAMLGGYFLSRRIAAYLDRGKIRMAVLVISGVSGLMIIIKSLINYF